MDTWSFCSIPDLPLYSGICKTIHIIMVHKYPSTVHLTRITHLERHKLAYQTRKLDYCPHFQCLRLHVSFNPSLPIDKTCQWHFQYDCAQAAETLSELWEGKGTVCQVLWAVVRVWSSGVCRAPHIPDVSLPARAHQLLSKAHAAEGLHNRSARYVDASLPSLR